ncbi:MAG: response regulator [Treponema sp.]|nr:response regulator [Treponema sp.]
MAEGILFIAENSQNFLVKALLKSFKDSEFDVGFCLPYKVEVEVRLATDYSPRIIILYLERIGSSDNNFFSYIKSVMKREPNKYQLYFIGNKGEINQAYEIIGRHHVRHAFERPVDTEDLFKVLKHNSGDYALSEAVHKYEINPDKLTILVIDDEVIQLHAMERWLQKSYNVLTEKSGTDGIALLKQYKVDMILLDYEMPILSGFEVFQLLKSDPETERIPIVFLTANNDSEIVRQVVELKPAGYLLKNTAPGILLQRIDEIFDKIFRV